MSLKVYNQKRDFKKTSEPAGKEDSHVKGHRFVIQKHDASRLHYDFRLEMGGTLKSWAVPKGVPFVKGEKRLAVQVEDHPVSYIDFEGTIPKGQYGGGTVMVWDRGTFEPLSETPSRDLENGKLHFVLNGAKLQGQWYLVRLRDQKDWLLIRGDKNMPAISKKEDDTSALSGKSMEEIGQGKRVWNSNKTSAKPSNQSRKPSVKKAAFNPKFIPPMKARLVESPPAGDWIYEVKLDGFRAMAFKKGQATRLLSRNEKDFAAKFPEIVDALVALAARDAVIDGEIVAVDAGGRSSFQLLQAYEMGEERPPILFYAFDLLRLNGKSLEALPLQERKSLLQELLKNGPEHIRFSTSLEGDVKQLLAQARKLGLEGLIGKRKDSSYEAGKRSGAWIKLKLHLEQEFVIGGFSDPEGSRQHFGALVVGYYDHRKLHCAGKVGAGFNEALLENLSLQFQKLVIESCPFANLPEKKSGRFGAGITVAEMKRCHWLKPRIVCQVRFSEWTRDGKLRQPVFLGLREDKTASEVVRERAQ